MGVDRHRSLFVGIEEEELINNPIDWPDCGPESPWDYRGWKIWKWTGWKGNWCRRNPFYSGEERFICSRCGKAIELWDIVYVSQSCLDWMQHAECVPDYQGTIAGQWLAMNAGFNGQPREDVKYMVSCAPGETRLYHRGECFDISSPDPPTYYWDPEDLLALREDALERLKALIDHEVKHANL